LRSAGDGLFVAQQTPSLLLPVWFGLFLGNAALAANEQILLFSMGNTRSSEVRVYFSPSCNACRSAILALGNTATLYPVEENDGDMDSIIRLAALLKANVPLREALPRSISPDEPVPHLPLYRRMFLSAQLVRNKAMVLRQGFRALPLIEVNGMPTGKAAPLEEKGEPESRPPNGEQDRQAPEDPERGLAPSSSSHGSALDGDRQRQFSASRTPDAQTPAGTLSDDAARRGQPRQNPAGQSGPGGQRAVNEQSQVESKQPDFLLPGVDDLSRCSRTSGQPCN
jgi:hypothetical protein